LIHSILKDKVPETSLAYCIELWNEAPFQFHISKNRSSKLGDYRFDPRDKSHRVTVNEGLNPYQFLITYIHEVAHRRVHEVNRRQKPHGQLWKNEFQKLMLPVLNTEIFPDEVLRPLAKHMKNPKASAAADPKLTQAIRKYNENYSGTFLSDLSIDDRFELRGRAFRYLEKKRTRALCLDLTNQKKYLIPLLAEVEKV